MIIFFESGRLGNQLFQYCAMRKFNRQGLILAIGMSDLKAGFLGVDFVGTSRLGRLLIQVVRRIGEKRIDYAAQSLRLLTLVEEVFTETDISFKVTPGIITSLVYFKAGYYQSENIVDKEVTRSIAVKPEFIARTDQFLESIPSNQKDRFFVHVRRGDYIGWPNRDTPAVLPLSWYREQMDRVRDVNPNALFIVVSDDKPYVDEFFADEMDVIISREDMMTDFAIMTRCLGGGILSASSFSWWASYFVQQTTTDSFFTAPTFWAGHRIGSWHPSRIQTTWFNYANVD